MLLHFKISRVSILLVTGSATGSTRQKGTRDTRIPLVKDRVFFTSATVYIEGIFCVSLTSFLSRYFSYSLGEEQEVKNRRQAIKLRYRAVQFSDQAYCSCIIGYQITWVCMIFIVVVLWLKLKVTIHDPSSTNHKVVRGRRCAVV